MNREPDKTAASQTHGHLDDQRLVQATLAGDQSAFDELVTKYRDRVYVLAFHMLWNEQEAEDVAQEVFVRAYRSLTKFRWESGFFTWLYRIAVNLVYTQTRKAARRRQIHEAAYQEMQRSLPVQPTPAEACESDEWAAHLHEAIKTLDPRFRQVLVLRELEGYEIAEVAKLLNLPKGTVKSRLFRAHAELRRIIASRNQMGKEKRSGHAL